MVSLSQKAKLLSSARKRLNNLERRNTGNSIVSQNSDAEKSTPPNNFNRDRVSEAVVNSNDSNRVLKSTTSSKGSRDCLYKSNSSSFQGDNLSSFNQQREVSSGVSTLGNNDNNPSLEDYLTTCRQDYHRKNTNNVSNRSNEDNFLLPDGMHDHKDLVSYQNSGQQSLGSNGECSDHSSENPNHSSTGRYLHGLSYQSIGRDPCRDANTHELDTPDTRKSSNHPVYNWISPYKAHGNISSNRLDVVNAALTTTFKTDDMINRVSKQHPGYGKFHVFSEDRVTEFMSCSKPSDHAISPATTRITPKLPISQDVPNLPTDNTRDHSPSIKPIEYSAVSQSDPNQADSFCELNLREDIYTNSNEKFIYPRYPPKSEARVNHLNTRHLFSLNDNTSQDHNASTPEKEVIPYANVEGYRAICIPSNSNSENNIRDVGYSPAQLEFTFPGYSQHEAAPKTDDDVIVSTASSYRNIPLYPRDTPLSVSKRAHTTNHNSPLSYDTTEQSAHALTASSVLPAYNDINTTAVTYLSSDNSNPYLNKSDKEHTSYQRLKNEIQALERDLKALLDRVSIGDEDNTLPSFNTCDDSFDSLSIRLYTVRNYVNEKFRTWFENFNYDKFRIWIEKFNHDNVNRPTNSSVQPQKLHDSAELGSGFGKIHQTDHERVTIHSRSLDNSKPHETCPGVIKPLRSALNLSETIKNEFYNLPGSSSLSNKPKEPYSEPSIYLGSSNLVGTSSTSPFVMSAPANDSLNKKIFNNTLHCCTHSAVSLSKNPNQTSGDHSKHDNYYGCEGAILWGRGSNSTNATALGHELISILDSNPDSEYIELGRNQIKLFYQSWVEEAFKNNMLRGAISRLNHSVCINFDEILNDFNDVVDILGNVTEALELEKRRGNEAMDHIKQIQQDYDKLIRKNAVLKQKYDDNDKVKELLNSEIIRRLERLEEKSVIDRTPNHDVN